MDGSSDRADGLRIALGVWRCESVARGRSFPGAPLSAMVAGHCRLADIVNLDHSADRGPILRSQAHRVELQIAGPILRSQSLDDNEYPSGYRCAISSELDWSMKFGGTAGRVLVSSAIIGALSLIGCPRDSAGNLDCIMELCSFNSGRIPVGFSLAS